MKQRSGCDSWRFPVAEYSKGRDAAVGFVARWLLALTILFLVQSCNEHTAPTSQGQPGLQQTKGVTVPLFGPIEEAIGVTWPANTSQLAFEGPCDVIVILGEGKRSTVRAIGGLLTEEMARVNRVLLYLTRHPVSLGEALNVASAAAKSFEKHEDQAYVDFEAKLRKDMPRAEAGFVRIARIALSEKALLEIVLLTKVDESGWYVQVALGPAGGLKAR